MSYKEDVATLEMKIDEIKWTATELWHEQGGFYMEGPESWNARLSRVAESFKRFHETDPQPLESIISDLDGVLTQLQDPVTEKMDSVKGDLRDWQGVAAEAFVDNYLTPFPRTVHNQLEFVVELMGAAQGSKAILDSVRGDAISVADRTVQALQRALELEEKADEGRKWAIIGCIIAVAAAIPTAGWSTAGAYGVWMLGLGLATAGGAAGIEAADAAARPITGTDTDTILEQMNDNLDELGSAMTQEEDILADVLQRDAEIIDANMSRILPARPEIADNPDGADFELPTNPGS